MMCAGQQTLHSQGGTDLVSTSCSIREALHDQHFLQGKLLRVQLDGVYMIRTWKEHILEH